MGLGCSAGDDLARHLTVRAVGSQRLLWTAMPMQLPFRVRTAGQLRAGSSVSLAQHFLGVRISLMNIGLAAGDSRGDGRAGHCQLTYRCSANRLARFERAARLNVGDIATDLLLRVNSKRIGLGPPITTVILDFEAAPAVHSQIAAARESPLRLFAAAIHFSSDS